MPRATQTCRSALALVTLLAAGTATSATPTWQSTTGFASFPADRPLAQSSAIGVDQRGHVWIVDRCEAKGCADSKVAPIVEFDANGRFVQNFGAGLFVGPHGMHIDRNGDVWVTDFRNAVGKGNQVFKFSRDGKILLTLGKAGVSGNSEELLSQPADVAVARDGSIYVIDGHGDGSNERIVHYNSAGKFLSAFGRHGAAPGEFNTAHALVIDSRGRLIVGDRGNGRVQVFDATGKFLFEWKQFGGPSGLAIDARDHLYISGTLPGAANVQCIWVADARNGKTVAFIPGEASADGRTLTAPEDIAVNRAGDIFGPDMVAHNIRHYVAR